jgi:hypothetical protein
MKKQHIGLLNIAFIAIGGAILIFLLRAPGETTPKLPKNQDHMRFFSIESKKEAEMFCSECHSPGKQAPLPIDHPPPYRCLFCHKKDA